MIVGTPGKANIAKNRSTEILAKYAIKYVRVSTLVQGEEDKSGLARQVKRWHKEWLAGELFENLPCDGIVVKVASGESKNRLGSNSKCPNWALALKD